MNADWMDSIPFLFSITLKLASSLPDRYYSRILVKDIPKNYRLTEQQKKTIASQALDANERIVFVVSMAASILIAAAVCLKKGYEALFLVFLLFLVIALVLTNFWMNLGDLGWLETRVRMFGREIRRVTVVTAILVFVDLWLAALVALLPAAK
jgi:hypothetical protein